MQPNLPPGKVRFAIPPARPSRCGRCHQPATSVDTTYTPRGPKPRLCCGHCAALAASGLTMTAAIDQGVRK
jgi:hypothetical protein